ncbi:MAG: 2-oxo acid dehydrogenase subunit E2 [Ktedonobacterales bacterium]
MKPPVQREQPRAAYQAVLYPRYQRLAAAAAQTMRHKPMIHGLLEIDVSGPRAALREHKARTGESLSFTAFLTTCVAKAVEEHRAVQAFHLGRTRLALFDDVDIVTRVEREVAGQNVVIPYIIRAANRKTFREQHAEIRAAQVADLRRQVTQFRFLPTALYRPFASAFVWIGARRPRLWKQLMGTVGITSVGMFGSGAGWGIPASAPTALMVTVGGIGQKQTIVDGRIVTREYLCLTVSVDHELVDGAPAARFTQRLKELIESGYGLALDAPAGEPEQAMAAAVIRRRRP